MISNDFLFESDAEILDGDTVSDDIKDSFIDDPESDISLADEKKVKELIDKIPVDDEEECCTKESLDSLFEADDKEPEDEEELSDEEIKKMNKEENEDKAVRDNFIDFDDDTMFEADLEDIYPDDDEFLAKPSFSADNCAEYNKALKGMNSDHLEDIYPNKDEFLVREGSEEDDEEEDDDLEEFAFELELEEHCGHCEGSEEDDDEDDDEVEEHCGRCEGSEDDDDDDEVEESFDDTIMGSFIFEEDEDFDLEDDDDDDVEESFDDFEDEDID